MHSELQIVNYKGKGRGKPQNLTMSRQEKSYQLRRTKETCAKVPPITSSNAQGGKKSILIPS
jgi:hypothetical protein